MVEDVVAVAPGVLKRVGQDRQRGEVADLYIWRACLKEKVPRGHPNQLRHRFATKVRHAYDLEAAQVLLGRSRADVTRVYAGKNLALAAKVAAEIG